LPKTWLPKTMWLTLFCLVGLGPVIAIKVAAPPSSVVGPAPDQSKPDQSKVELASAPNETAKSDRLELPSARTEPEIIVPGAKPAPAETPSASAETASTSAVTSPTSVETTSSTGVETAVKKVADRHWRDANARLLPVTPPRRHTKSKELQQSASDHLPSERPEAWHCRQDAMGSLLRSLDLSPRCNL
jgi:hypothetical protein